jgi:hypothetical protein
MKTNLLLLFREIIAVYYCEHHTRYIATLCGKMQGFF